MVVPMPNRTRLHGHLDDHKAARASGRPAVPSGTAPFEAHLASEQHVFDARRLRYAVFPGEMGVQSAVVETLPAVDIDRFDGQKLPSMRGGVNSDLRHFRTSIRRTFP